MTKEHLVHVSDEDVKKFQGYLHDNVLDEDDIDDVLDEETEEVKPNAGENVPNDDMGDDYMIRIYDIDDDSYMSDPFNMNSKLDDTGDELDEEED